MSFFFGTVKTLTSVVTKTTESVILIIIAEVLMTSKKATAIII